MQYFEAYGSVRAYISTISERVLHQLICSPPETYSYTHVCFFFDGQGPGQLLDQCNSFWAPYTANYTIDPTDPITSLEILGQAFNTGRCINTKFKDLVNS